jgi:hypothetical protein
MKLSKTTLYGTTSAVSFACALAPRLDNNWQLWFSLAGCASLALLGTAAKDCPANCPGTDGAGHARPKINVLLGPLAIAAAFILAWLICSGCTAPNPVPGTVAVPVPAYVVSPALSTASNTASQIAAVAGPLSGTGNALPLAINGIFAVLAAVSAAWAAHKSQVASTLAAGVASAGPAAVQAVLTSAADSTKFAAVASALNDALPTGQAPGCPTCVIPGKPI